MRRFLALAAPLAVLASLLFAPGSAHAVVNGTFTITGGNQQQVGQSTITITSTTGQTVTPTQTTNGNKKTFGFILPDGTYTVTGTAGGQTFTQTFTATGNGTASGGYNIDFGGLQPIAGGGITTGTVGGPGLTGFTGPNPATTPIFGFGVGTGFESNNLNVSVGGSFFNPVTAAVSQTNPELVGQLFASVPVVDFLPQSGTTNAFVRFDANLAVPFSGSGSSTPFSAVPVGSTTGTPGSAIVQQTGVDLTFKGGPGMVFPGLWGMQAVLYGGVNFKSFIATVNIPSVSDNFNGTAHTIQPVVGLGATLPVSSLLFPFVTNQLGFDTGGAQIDAEYQHEFSGGTSRLNGPGSNSFSYGTVKFISGDQFIVKLEMPFGSFFAGH